ncbi:hypothetical protein BB559_005123, partial [Furculomyces boomerangus]
MSRRKTFDEYMENIKNKSLDAYSYLENIGFQRWATAKFPAPRYGHITFNIAESTNKKMYKYKEKYFSNTNIYVDKVIPKIETNMTIGGTKRAARYDTEIFSVKRKN